MNESMLLTKLVAPSLSTVFNRRYLAAPFLAAAQLESGTQCRRMQFQHHLSTPSASTENFSVPVRYFCCWHFSGLCCLDYLDRKRKERWNRSWSNRWAEMITMRSKLFKNILVYIIVAANNC